jgi:hypothetical protein
MTGIGNSIYGVNVEACIVEPPACQPLVDKPAGGLSQIKAQRDTDYIGGYALILIILSFEACSSQFDRAPRICRKDLTAAYKSSKNSRIQHYETII